MQYKTSCFLVTKGQKEDNLPLSPPLLPLPLPPALHMLAHDPQIEEENLPSLDGVDATDAHGWTPFMAAAAEGHLHVVKYLLEYDAELGAEDDLDRTALFLAAYNNHPVSELMQCSSA